MIFITLNIAPLIVLGNDFLSAGFFVMVIRGCYNLLAKIFTHYYEKIISRVYASVEVEEGDQCYEWLAGKPPNHQTII